MRRLTRFLAALLLPLSLGACGSSTVSPVKLAATSPFQLEVAVSDITIGRDRFTFGLLRNDRPVEPSQTRISFYSVHGTTATLRQTFMAHFNNFAAGLPRTGENSSAEEIKGVFVSYPTFRQPGVWMADVRFPYHGQIEDVRQGFRVERHSLSPAVGSPAPRSHNPTIFQMPASKLDSGHPPDDMHRLSIAQAIAQHKPLVVLFATPAFCTSRMCGPQTEIVEEVEKRFRGRVNFIHIEVYKNANPADGFAPTMVQWHLQTEPWVFVIDKRGVIAAKFEGPTGASEIESALRKVL